jgi:hypothetical protein
MSLILDGTNGLSDVDGSASTPAIRGTDTNTGIFFPAADTIAFAEGGAEVARFDSSGNLGIGTASPTSKLTLDGTLQIGAAGTASDVGITKIATRNIRFDSAPTAGTGITVNVGTDASQNSTFVVNGNALFNSGYGSAVIAYGCRAWVNFNGTGTVAIRASGNVSSITDNGTGDYTVNFSTAMPDANYSPTIATQRNGINNAVWGSVKSDSTMSTSNVRIATVDVTPNFVDPLGVFVGIFR